MEDSSRTGALAPTEAEAPGLSPLCESIARGLRDLPERPTDTGGLVFYSSITLFPPRSWTDKITRAVEVNSQPGQPPPIVRVLPDAVVEQIPAKYYAPHRLDRFSNFNLKVRHDSHAYSVRVSVIPMYVGEAKLGAEPAIAFICGRTTISTEPASDLLPSGFWRATEHAFRKEILRRISARAAREKERIPNAFGRDGMAAVPVNPVVFAQCGAMWSAGERARLLENGWIADPQGKPIFLHKGTRGGVIRTYPNPRRSLNEPMPTAGDLWRVVEGLDERELANQVLWFCLAQVCVDPEKAMEPVLITEDAMLQYKGFRGRGEERRALLDKINSAMEHWRNIAFKIEAYHAFDPKTRSLKSISFEDRILDIVPVHKQQHRLDGTVDIVQRMWSIRAGQWAYYYLNPQGKPLLGKVDQCVLQFDHRTNRPAERLAARISARLLMLFHLKKLKNKTLTWSRERLLREVYELPECEARDKHWGRRTREALHGAVRLVNAAGLYRIDFPEDRDRNVTKGWVKPWLETHGEIYLMPCAPKFLPEVLSTKSVPLVSGTRNHSVGK